MTETVYRAINEKEFFISLQDRGRSFNINMHTFFCFALSEEEAIGKMIKERPELKPHHIESVRVIDVN